jgi:hypothetical protein
MGWPPDVNPWKIKINVNFYNYLKTTMWPPSVIRS